MWTTERDDPDQVGPKFARLHRMRAAGLPVPPLFCLPAEAFRQVARPLLAGIGRELGKADYSDPGSIEDCSARIGELFQTVPLAEGLAAEIASACDRHFGPDALVAVRACALDGEDSAEDPHAGMSESFLYVSRDAVLSGVRRCWASGFTAQSLLYRHVQGLDPLRTEIAVGIQEMVLGERSFVLFTQDPRTGDRTPAVAAGLGIGEGVVRERVGVDHYFLRHDTVERRTVAKPELLGLDPQRPVDGPVLLPVPAERRDAPVLTDAEVRQLAAIGTEVEELFGGPQDIEGTFTADGRLHLVQARPVAIDPTLRAQWSNANITESFPGVTTALTYSVAQRFYRTIFYDLYRRLGVDARTLHGDRDRLERMIGRHNGRIYYRLDTWYHLHSRLTVFPLFQASWEKMMGLDPGPPEPRPGPLRLAGPLTKVAYRFLVHDSTMRDFEAWWESVMATRRGRDWSRVDPLARIQDLRAVWREAGDQWGVTLINDSVLSTYATLARNLLERWAPEVPLNDLLCGEEENRSVAVVIATVRLAERLRDCPDLLGALDRMPSEQVWDAVRRGEFGADIADAFTDHVLRHGDRGLEELKMEQPNLRQAPWTLLELTSQYAPADLDAETLIARELAVRDAAERRLEATLGPRSPRLRLIRAVLARLRRCVGHRENSRYCRSELFGLAKEIFHHLGADLAADGVLRDPGEVVHLTEDELLGWFEGTGTCEGLQSLADARRAEFERPGPELPMRFTTLGPVRRTRPAGPDSLPADEGELRGLGSSAGIVRGRARVVLDPREPIEPGTILVARETDPGWLFLMLRARGIVVERGTLLSHTAITGRKFAIPTIVALPAATTAIPDGALIEMDGTSGRVTVVQETS